MSTTQESVKESGGTGVAAQPELEVPVRTVFIGALCAALTAVIVTQAEMVLSSVRVGYMQFSPVGLGILLLIVGVNRAVKKFSAAHGLTSSDLLVIYCMMLVAGMVSSHGIVEKWIPMLVAMKYYQNNGNAWHSLYDPRTAGRLVPYDPRNAGHQSVVTSFYEQMLRGASVPWHAWIAPLLNWGVLIALIIFAFLCLTTILRKQWVDNEKLAFPLAQLPLEIADDEDRHTFFRNPIMWIGALIPVLVYLVKGLHQAFPEVPDITLQISLSDYVKTPPYDQAAARFFFIISFAAIGFFYLLPQDVLFSIWFFFISTHVEQVIAISHNMDMPGMSIYPVPMFIGYQTVGAYLVLAASYFWFARGQLRRVCSAAFGRGNIDDSQELMPYKLAFWGLFGSIAASSVWLWSIGMSIWLALFELLVFIFITAVVLARSTAEAGMLMTESTFRPIDIYRMVAPVHALGPSNLTALAFFDTMFINDQRGLVFTGLLDSARISGGTQYRRRSFFGILILAIGVAVVVAGALNIAIPYHIGAARMDSYMEISSPQTSFRDYAAAFSPGSASADTSHWQMPTFFAVGVAVTLILTLLRSSFFWWPLHPLGYALAGSWSTAQFWFPCLIAWVLKTVTLRYGGLSLYARLRPFFLGLVIGEFGIAVAFVLLNMATAWLLPNAKIPPPPFPWG